MVFLEVVPHCVCTYKITDTILPKLTVVIDWIQISDQVLRSF